MPPAPRSNGALRLKMRGENCNGFILQLQTDGVLVADIVLHNKRQEGKTGGDFGLVIVHPKIVIKSNSIEARKGFSSGLLCQAKMKRRDGKWGDLKNQSETLPAHLDYSSLVLYSYLDEERSELNPLAWKLCSGSSLPELERSLKKNTPGEVLDAVDVILRLGRSEIGTSDQATIDEVISPSVRQHFELRIYWSQGEDPKGPVEVKVTGNEQLPPRFTYECVPPDQMLRRPYG